MLSCASSNKLTKKNDKRSIKKLKIYEKGGITSCHSPYHIPDRKKYSLLRVRDKYFRKAAEFIMVG